MRQRSALPSYLRLETLDSGQCKMQFKCQCGYVGGERIWPTVERCSAGPSRATLRCPSCRRYIYVGSDREV